MLYGLLVTLLIIVCLLLILVILVQQGKGGIGLGSSFGGAQMLFGGSGGQDIFQKITWTLGSLFMLGSLGLFLLGSKGLDYSVFLSKKNYQKKQVQMPVAPVNNYDKNTNKIEIPVSQNPAASQEMPKQ